MGIEPTLSAWKAEVLPLNYTRLIYFALARNVKRAHQIKKYGGGGRIRTFEGRANKFTVCPL